LGSPEHKKRSCPDTERDELSRQTQSCHQPVELLAPTGL
jgi:hypothetical protein